MNRKIPTSAIVVFFISMAIIFFRMIVPPVEVLSWDVFGYYLYLPAKFIYHDLALTDQSWLYALIQKYEPTSTLYQAQMLANGNWVMKYSMGLAIVFSPFFLIGHALAYITGYPADGFSLPYQYSIAAGGIIFAIIGLIYLRKVLLHFFSENISIIVLIIIVAGTNYFQLITFDGTLLSHNFLFTFYAMLIWYTIKWHENPKITTSILIGGLCGIIILIRPSDMVCLLIPLLWNINNKETLLNKLALLRRNYAKVLLAGAVLILVGLPQLIYWKIITGHFLFYSYNNPGEGFEFLSPYTAKYLFSFRKGWLIYTPVMVFALAGFVNLYRKKRALFPVILIFFLVNLYVISSWSCWWYAGGSYSSRSLVPSYTLLALPLGYFIEDIIRKKKLSIIFSIFAVCLIILNLFQTWQFENKIISAERMTMKYYFSVFGKTFVDKEDEKLLLVERGLEATEHFSQENEYTKRTLYNRDFEDISDTGLVCHSGKGSFKMDSVIPFAPGPDIMYKEITANDHAWIRAGAWIYIPVNYSEELPLLILTFHHDSKPYKYRAQEIPAKEVVFGQWNYLTADYLTPEVRSVEDNLKVYIWHRGKNQIWIDDFFVDVYEPK
ncbi:MAG: hypothetical protein WC341_10855 [Bacteroidales bacterium]|jgi:hypothetical protein